VTGLVPAGADTVEVNGVAATLTGNTFAATVPLSDGPNTVTATATGDGGPWTVAVAVTLDTVAPAVPNVQLILAGLLTGSPATVLGLAGSVEADGLVTATDTRTSQAVTVTAGDAGDFLAHLTAQAGDTLSIFVTDRAGNVGPAGTLQVASIVTSVSDTVTGVTSGAGDITVRGTFQNLPSGAIGVTANGTPGLVEGNQFVVRLPVDASTTSLTLMVRDFSGNLSAVVVPVAAPPSALPPAITLRATSAAGLVPLTTRFEYSSPIAVTPVALDADGDGTADATGAVIAKFAFTYSQPGLYLPRLTVTDADGHVYTAVTVVHVADPTAMDARLQPVWQGVKDALRGDDIATAAQFVHSDRRAAYQSAWGQLPVDTLSGVDQIMTSIQLTEVGPAAAQYDMQRAESGQTFSYPIWFQLDQDGLWRLLRF